MTDYSLPIVPRYAEIDQQAVVFNGHYLTWFDEAVTGFFDHLGASYPDLMAAGLDMQLVHTEIDYAAPVRWRDAVRVEVTCEQVGTTSFTIGLSVLRRRDGSEELVAVRGRNVYVVVSTEDWIKRPVPDALRKALS
ncbi:MAG TPA: thioesterase family protein [Mycobacterium sp.]|nr:thioesterase family protein [Mycobacterium sp.]